MLAFWWEGKEFLEQLQGEKMTVEEHVGEILDDFVKKALIKLVYKRQSLIARSYC